MPARSRWLRGGVGKVGVGGGLGESYLSISASPQRLSPAAPSPWRDELPPALDALCSVAKRAPREPAALGAGRALGRPAPRPRMRAGEAGRACFGPPSSPKRRISPFSGAHSFIHPSSETEKGQVIQRKQSVDLPHAVLTKASLPSLLTAAPE